MEPNPDAMQLHLDNRPGNVQRKSRLLSALLMLAILPLWPTLSFAGVETILTDDAYTSSSSPAKKFGKKKGLLVSGSMRSFLKFNLATLPSGMVAADVEKATLKLFASKRRKAGSFDVFAVTGPWSERSITHRTAPGLADHAETGAPVSVGGVNQFVMVDLTTLVRDWVDFIATSGASGRANNGVALVSLSGLSAELDSKESDSTAHDAALEIVLTGGGGVGPAGPIGPAGAVGPQGAAGPTGPAGPRGTTGPAGLNGAAGATGAQGPAGPAGAQGPAGADGLAGPAGLMCWDLNANGQADLPAEDINLDTFVNTLDCAGPQGAAGADGADGATGATGPAGANGATGATGNVGPAGPIGPAGATGANGATGAAGPAGPTGPAGPPGVSALELVTATSASDSNTSKTQTVSCPGVKKALGGGGSVTVGVSTNLAIQASAPTGGPPPTAPTGWSVTGTETDTVGGNWSVTAYVMCATVP